VLGIYAYIDHNFYVGSVPTVRVKVGPELSIHVWASVELKRPELHLQMAETCA
jgi:hypothetical protein